MIMYCAISVLLVTLILTGRLPVFSISWFKGYIFDLSLVVLVLVKLWARTMYFVSFVYWFASHINLDIYRKIRFFPYLGFMVLHVVLFLFIVTLIFTGFVGFSEILV